MKKTTEALAVGTDSRQRKAAAFKRLVAAGVTACLCASMFGCAGANTATKSDNSKGRSTTSAEKSQEGSGEYDLEFSKRDLDPSYDANTATRITLSGDSARVQGDGATADGSTVTVMADGTYLIEGSLSNGRVQVSTGDEDKVQLVLAGVDIHSETGPALYVENADKVFVTLAEGTANSLSDGSGQTRDADEDGDELNATLMSKDDLTINGSGSLTVQGNYYHGIKSKDDLIVTGGTIDVTSKEDAFNGNDCIKVANGTFTVNAGDDAFHSDTFTYFADGNVDVQSCTEGYEGEAIIIDGGTHSVMAEDDALNASLPDSSSATTQGAGFAQGQQPQRNQQGQQGTNGSTPPELSGNAKTTTVAMQERGDGQFKDGQTRPDRSNGSGQQQGQQRPQMPNDRTMPELPDGEEPPEMPNDMQGNNANDRMDGGGGMAPTSSSCLIQINGGTLYLVGGNDAIDSNGNVEFNGGTVVACGPSNGMDGALDYDLNATINGGTILLVGSIGSTRGLDASPQDYTTEQLSGAAGSTVQLVAADGTVLAEAKAPTAFQSVLSSSDQNGITVKIS